MFHVRVLINTLVNSKVFLPLSSRIFWLKMSRPSLFVSAMKLSNSQYTVQGRIKGCKTGAGKSENIVYIFLCICRSSRKSACQRFLLLWLKIPKTPAHSVVNELQIIKRWIRNAINASYNRIVAYTTCNFEFPEKLGPTSECVGETTVEIPYWWRFNTQIWVVLPDWSCLGWNLRQPIKHYPANPADLGQTSKARD